MNNNYFVNNHDKQDLERLQSENHKFKLTIDHLNKKHELELDTLKTKYELVSIFFIVDIFLFIMKI